LDDAIVPPDRSDHGIGRWRTPDCRLGVCRVVELGLFDEPNALRIAFSRYSPEELSEGVRRLAQVIGPSA
jgi:hypothetical protein